MTQAKMADAAENAALVDMAITYRGSSELGQRYYNQSAAGSDIGSCCKIHRSVYRPKCGDGIGNGQRNGLLLLCLPACARNPAQDNAVASVNATGKGTHSKVSCSNVHCRTGQDEAKDGEDFGDCDVPGPLIHPSCM